MKTSARAGAALGALGAFGSAACAGAADRPLRILIPWRDALHRPAPGQVRPRPGTRGLDLHPRADRAALLPRLLRARRAAHRGPHQRPHRARGPRVGRRDRQLGLLPELGRGDGGSPPRPGRTLPLRLLHLGVRGLRAGRHRRGLPRRAVVAGRGRGRRRVRPAQGPLRGVRPRRLRENAIIVRPGLIVGPGDNTDRWTYWPVRVNRGGEVLAPNTPADPVQNVDARDLSEWIVRLVETRVTGAPTTRPARCSRSATCWRRSGARSVPTPRSPGADRVHDGTRGGAGMHMTNWTPPEARRSA